MRVGILAVQGAFIEHERVLRRLGADPVEIRQRRDFADVDGLILPGGESTAQALLLKKLELFDAVRSAVLDGLPVLATCAGLILLARKLDRDDSVHLGTLPVTVRRNAYGRQLGSFETRSSVGDIADFPLVFIRAPFVTETGPGVDVRAAVGGRTVGVRYENQIGLAFHPEMTDDVRVHEMFIRLIRGRLGA